ncbi:MAG: SGNH/GDSL hydrolase family protein [Pseudobdellovibrionaceae bacterium]
MTKISFIFIFFCLGLTINSSASADSFQSEFGIHAYGDSLTYGSGVTDRHEGFAFQIARRLDLTINNQAIGGTTIEQWGQLPSILGTSFNKGQIVIFLPGFNDSRTFYQDPSYSARFAGILKRIFDHLESAEVEAYIGTCIKAYSGWYSKNSGFDQALLDGSCDNLAQITRIMIAKGNYHHIHLVDTNASISFTANEMNSDLLHPNELGHKKIADFFLSKMKI